MDFPTEDLPASNEPPLPSSMLHTPNLYQFGEPPGMGLALGSQVIPEILLAPGLEFEESYMLASPGAFAALDAPLQNTSLPVDAVEVADVSMGPPPRARKKKASTLRAKDWEPHKSYIKQLHNDQGLSLEEVKNRMESEFGFKAEYVYSEMMLNVPSSD